MFIATIKRRDFPEGINVLSKGNSPFFIPKSLILEFDLPYYNDGQEIDEDLYIELKKINEIFLCRKKALDLLARREHTKMEIKAKLVQRKFSLFAIENTISYIVNKNYLSEERFCETFIVNRNRKGEGKFLVVTRLQNKGISSTLANSIYDKIVNYDMEHEACLKAFNSIIDKNNEKEVVKYKLIKKGFNNSIINSVLEQEYKLLKNN